MPKKRELTPSARKALEKHLRASFETALVVRSVFGGYFTEQEAIMKDVEELVRHHDRIKERLKVAEGY